MTHRAEPLGERLTLLRAASRNVLVGRRTAAERLKRIYVRSTVLGTYWADYRDAWLTPTRTDGLPDRVLDAGCGRGETLREFQRFKVPVDYYGVDLGVGDPTWEFRVSAVADLHRLPFRSGSFDKVICSQVLEHVDHPYVVLGELARVVRPGGRIFLSIPFVWHLHQEPYDRMRFTRHGIDFMVKSHGLVAEVVQPMGGYFTVLRYVLGSHSLVFGSLPPWLRAVAIPLSNAARIIDAYIGAPAAFALDHLDRDHKLTLGYFLDLIRPENQGESLATREAARRSDPYSCPACRADGPPLARGADAWACRGCGARYEVRSGVPVLTMPGV